ncbi:hypothetical protein BDN67DRAFT_527148 [Paxillus ammoniavirescens]|nr:hypothetical protein BDN67DRAFT_527148 [Paxillus ammoniavirescens]
MAYQIFLSITQPGWFGLSRTFEHQSWASPRFSPLSPHILPSSRYPSIHPIQEGVHSFPHVPITPLSLPMNHPARFRFIYPYEFRDFVPVRKSP